MGYVTGPDGPFRMELKTPCVFAESDSMLDFTSLLFHPTPAFIRRIRAEEEDVDGPVHQSYLTDSYYDLRRMQMPESYQIMQEIMFSTPNNPTILITTQTGSFNFPRTRFEDPQSTFQSELRQHGP